MILTLLTVVTVTLDLVPRSSAITVRGNAYRNRPDEYVLLQMCGLLCSEQETCLVRNGLPTCLNNCPKSCSTRNSPVCGDNGETYTNMCLLKMRNCNTQDTVMALHRGACANKKPDRVDRCRQGCETLPTKQVCGSDTRTYRTFCDLSRSACELRTGATFHHYGACQEDECSMISCPWGQVCRNTRRRGPTCVCNSDCPAEELAVCGSDGKTYYNECHMRTENCLTGRNYQVVYRGICTNNTGDNKKRRIHRASVAFGPE